MPRTSGAPNVNLEGCAVPPFVTAAGASTHEFPKAEPGGCRHTNPGVFVRSSVRVPGGTSPSPPFCCSPRLLIISVWDFLFTSFHF